MGLQGRNAREILESTVPIIYGSYRETGFSHRLELDDGEELLLPNH